MKQRMRRSYRGYEIVIALYIFFYTPCLYAEHDSSLRTDLNFSHAFNEQFKSVSYVFIQADKDISNFDYLEWGIGLQYKTTLNWLSFLFYYQQGYSKVDPDNWSLEQKPSININTSTNIADFKISNQIRYEYRFRPDWSNYRIKNTMEISLPDVFLQPYVGWELFYENRDNAFMLNRIKFGIIKNINSNISLGTYYRVDYSNIKHQWEFTRQLIGIQVTMKY